MTPIANYHIAVLVLISISSGMSLEDCNPQCPIIRIKKLRAADCYNMNIYDFPTCIQGNIEVFDLSHNRLRKLKRGDLENYSGLKILYLYDNVITNIENGFFHNADSLVAVDLSINGISDLPPEIFHLPALSKLYLSQNANMNIVEVVEKAKPIKSPLARLDISFNELQSLPDLGEMIYLIEYNISGNDLINLTPRTFAGLCNLEYLHNSNMTVQFDSSCDCWSINAWLTQRNVHFKPFECDPRSQNTCAGNVDKESLAIFQKCKEKHKKVEFQGKMVKIVLPCVLVVIVIALGIAYYIYKKRQQKKVGRDQVRNSDQVNNSEVLDPLRRRHDQMICEFNKRNSKLSENNH